MSHRRSIAVLALAMLPVFVPAAPAFADETVVMLVASNAESSVRDIVAEYEKAHPGVKVQVSAAGSKVIAAQVAQGAAADLVLVSESTASAMSGVEKPVALYSTHTVLAVSKAGAAKIHGPKDIASAGVRLGSGTPGSVTEQFANDTFAKIGGPEFAAKAQGNVIIKKTAVEQLAKLLDDGSIDAAILLSSDVDAKMTQVPLGDKSVSLTYSGAVLKNAAHAARAREMLAMMTSSAGQAVLRAHHLEPLK